MLPLFATDQNVELMAPDVREFYYFLRRFNPRVTRGATINLNNASRGFTCLLICCLLGPWAPVGSMIYFGIGSVSVMSTLLGSYQLATA